MVQKMLKFVIEDQNLLISVDLINFKFHSKLSFPYLGEAYFKHYSIKCRSPMINLVWSTFNPISTNNPRPPKSVIIFYTKLDFFSIFQPKSNEQMIFFFASNTFRFLIRCRNTINWIWCCHSTWFKLDIRSIKF